MLRVKDIGRTMAEQIIVDEYIAIKIKWPTSEYLHESKVYWSTGNLDTSMLEIGIGIVSGEIRSITAVLPEDIVFLVDERKKVEDIVSGIPIVDISMCKNGRTIDDIGLFQVQCGEKRVNLFMSHNEVTSIIESGRVSFGLDKDKNICNILVSDLTEEESYQVRDTLEYALGKLSESE